ncbi:MAG: DUF389 domain-containing protein [Luteibaculaceae bacterium]
MPESNSDKSTGSPKISFLRFLSEVRVNLFSILNLKEDTDIENTVENIKRDIAFKGLNVWILIFSIFIASIGLNVGSTAVIIGAMLISPLMGPIIGVGYSLGVNDLQNLIKSGKNFVVMVVIGLVVSTLYFTISPLKDLNNEILARTTPTLLDVAVAFFGGLAGIIGASRRGKFGNNVVPGVAIATALMPPLCTAGFGLATLNFAYFAGAFYLFLINSVFISVATLLTVRYLDFPLVEFVNAAREKKVKRIIYVSLIVVSVPSAILFFQVWQKAWFSAKAEQYISKVIHYDGAKVVSKRVVNSGDDKFIEIFLIGEIVPENAIKTWENQMLEYGLKNMTLNVYQSRDNSSALASKLGSEIKTGILEDMFLSKEEQIRALEKELLRYKKQEVDLQQILKEVSVNSKNINRVGYGRFVNIDLEGKSDTIPTFTVYANYPLNKEELSRMSNFLKVRLNMNKVRVINAENY